MKDTPPEINAMIFAAMMRKSPEERLLMGFDMMATAREMVWSGIGSDGTEEERRSLFSNGFMVWIALGMTREIEASH